jgi:glycosyltransferase involved in cell wall biosynthesis
MSAFRQRLGDVAHLEHTGPKLLVVSPCRNEANFLRASANSVLAQTRRPDLWIIVDDGSTADTPSILAEFAARHTFIRVVRRADRGFRQVGPGVVHAFRHGLDQVDDREGVDYLCKLDLDLILPPAILKPC